MFKEMDNIVSDFVKTIDEVSSSIGKKGHNELIELERPYNVEKRRLKSLVNFGVTSEYMSILCLEEFKNREHRSALIMNRGRN